MDDGALIVAAPQWQFQRFGGRQSCRIARSDDGGRTWAELAELPYPDATPFVVDGRLLMFVQEKSHHKFQIVTTEDGGRTWTSPVTVLEDPVWNISTSMLEDPDTIYWAMDYSPEGHRFHGKVMVRLDRSKSPLDPQAWSTSEIVFAPQVPALLSRNLYPTTNPEAGGSQHLFCLEPNTVEVAGRIRVFTRCVIDRYATTNMAAVLDYDTDTNRLRFTQLAGWSA